MRRSVATLAACVLGIVALTPAVATAVPAAGPAPDAAGRAALAAGVPVAPKAVAGARPKGANPYLALLPDPAIADYSGWSASMGRQAAQKAKLRAQRLTSVAASPLVVDEDEPAGTRGANDDPASGQLVRDFGTAAGKNPKARILGALAPETTVPASRTPFTEDDGSIPLAGDTGIDPSRSGLRVAGAVIGDGPQAATGDFDVYRLTAEAGDRVTVDVDTPDSALDSVVYLYDAAGAVVAVNDDGAGTGLDSLLRVVVPADGDYYALVAGYRSVPADPFDSASGNGPGSLGAYDVTITALQDDPDFYAVKLRKGDVLGASVEGGAATLAVYDTLPRLAHGSDQDATAVFPVQSPLPGGGNAVTDYVAEEAGWHYVAVGGGAGAYDVTVEAYRPALEKTKPVQTLFLDFDGARVNTAIVGGAGVRRLSPFSAFLAAWGLTRADEDAVIDAVTAAVEENLRQDMIGSGLNARFALKVTNSRDHADTFGQDNVSRVVVGGTVAESGVDTIGIAQSIDPGNFATEETALVLLDYLSEPSGPAYSLNTYLEPGSDAVAFVGRALGNVVSHEAGHLFGNWHVDQFNVHADLMDQGGNFPTMFGVGTDRIGGTADDVDVDFGHDDFNPAEGFTGVENTLGRIAHGVTR
jgi:Bacterial pre-peptidase C-terminal domain